MPLRLFRLRNVATANVVGVLWAAAMFAWFFLSALYLQLVLGYTPLQVGLAFLPANLIMGAFSLGALGEARAALRHRAPLAIGLAARRRSASLLFARAPVDGSFVVDVLPGMLLLGFGAGIAFNPVLLAAMSDVAPEESGLASGIVNTSFMMGGALGLAVLASIAASRTTRWPRAGDGDARRARPAATTRPSSSARSSPARRRSSVGAPPGAGLSSRRAAAGRRDAARSTNSQAKAWKRWTSSSLEAMPSDARTAPPEGSPIART